MTFVQAVFSNLVNHFESQEIYPSLIVSVLLVVSLLAFYEFVIYRFVLHRSLYNKAFNICIALIPYFISTIILCLQSNLIITLGTIGALAIIRFRTAVKDPVDMIFIFWSIHIGIVCGCQLYELAIATSLIATVVLVVLNVISVGKKSHILIVNIRNLSAQDSIETVVKQYSSKYRVKSRNYTKSGINVVYEILTAKANDITEEISKLSEVERFSLMEYDPDDIL